ncbi:MAG: serine/threonine-protein phosphatase [Bacteroidaceae bacterium]|nr:serine/threonine-protein phosphatase [Bacteroidaceae bacterium]
MRFSLSQPLFIHELGQRSNQEDSLFPFDGQATAADRLFVLCDGMGGHEAGEVASASVCGSLGWWFRKHFSSDAVLTTSIFNEALSAAYEDLVARDKGTSEKKMGTTMTFLMFHAGGATIAHIGDSRVYHLRPGVDKPLFKTNDHSLVNDLIRLGEITEEEARTSPNRNVITRAMQPEAERRAKADIQLITDVQPGDWFYLCSDGMLERMNDDELVRLITDPTLSPEEKRAELIRRTADNKDNHTAWLIQVLDVEGLPVTSSEDTTDKDPVVMEMGVAEVAPPLQHEGIKKKPKKNKKNWGLYLLLILLLLLVALWFLKPCLSQRQCQEETVGETKDTILYE